MPKECDKIMKVNAESQSIGAFLDWLQNEQRVVLCRYEDRSDFPIPIHDSIEKLLARYFDIDLNKVERERRRMLSSIRRHHEEQRIVNYGRY